ncbi:20749_t:CDS:2, partial [Gigaspora margarita]
MGFKSYSFYVTAISKFAKRAYHQYFKDKKITSWNLYDFLLYRFKQYDFNINSQLESGYYLSFLEYFKNEHNVEELQLAIDTALNLKDNYCQTEYVKLSKEDLDCLSEKLSFTINHLNDSYVKNYIDDILAWYTELNTAPQRINSKMPEISPNCSYEEKIE